MSTWRPWQMSAIGVLNYRQQLSGLRHIFCGLNARNLVPSTEAMAASVDRWICQVQRLFGAQEGSHLAPKWS